VLPHAYFDPSGYLDPAYGAATSSSSSARLATESRFANSSSSSVTTRVGRRPTLGGYRNLRHDGVSGARRLVTAYRVGPLAPGWSRFGHWMTTGRTVTSRFDGSGHLAQSSTGSYYVPECNGPPRCRASGHPSAGQSGCAMEPSSLLQLLMSRAQGLHRYVEGEIPRRMRRVVSADDILQDIWITVVGSASDITSSGSDDFDPWITRIAQRRIADAIRRAGALKRGGRDVIIYERRQTTSFVDLFARVRSPQDTPSKQVSTREAVHAVQIALATLPESHRTAITLRYIEGRSHNQIAKAMCKSPSAINSLLFRGMRKLRGMLGSAGRFFSHNGTYVAPRRAT